MISRLRITAIPRWTSMAASGYSIQGRRTFMSNFFGKKELLKREEILRNQDDFELSVGTKITILNEENSPGYEKFDPESDMPDFEIIQWKQRNVKQEDIESTFSRQDVSAIIANAYKTVYNMDVDPSTNTDAELFDLGRRFAVVKTIQADMGINLNDAVMTQCHTVKTLYDELVKVVEERYVNERNPNGIVVRPNDFSAPNIYLNQERTPQQQKIILDEIMTEAREAQKL